MCCTVSAKIIAETFNGCKSRTIEAERVQRLGCCQTMSSLEEVGLEQRERRHHPRGPACSVSVQLQR